MELNAYEPPKSDIAVTHDRPGSIVKAVLIGTLIEVFGTLVVSILFGIFYGFILASRGMSVEQIQQGWEQLEPGSVYGLIASFLGLLVSILAGYVCARIANRDSRKPAYSLAGISFILGVVLGLGTYAWWTLVLFGLVSLGAVLLGAAVYNRKFRNIPP